MEPMPYPDEARNNANEVEEPDPVKLQLQPCPICTRTFVPATLAKHVKICEKMATKKRKQFDSSRQRREGTDLADFLPKNFGLPPSKQEPKTSPKPVQSAPVHVVKKVEETPKQPTTNVQKKNAPVSQPTPPKEKVKPGPKIPPTLQCPHCERGFGAKAYDRHVEWCKEKQRIANIQNNSSLNAAKERLQARTKYKAPSLITKRAVNREKYSGLSREESTNSLSDGGGGFTVVGNYGNNDKMPMSTSLTSSIMSDGTSVTNLATNTPQKKSDLSAYILEAKHVNTECQEKGKQSQNTSTVKNAPEKKIRSNSQIDIKKEVVEAGSKIPARRRLVQKPNKKIDKTELEDKNFESFRSNEETSTTNFVETTNLTKNIRSFGSTEEISNTKNFDESSSLKNIKLEIKFESPKKCCTKNFDESLNIEFDSIEKIDTFRKNEELSINNDDDQNSLEYSESCTINEEILTPKLDESSNLVDVLEVNISNDEMNIKKIDESSDFQEDIVDICTNSINSEVIPNKRRKKSSHFQKVVVASRKSKNEEINKNKILDEVSDESKTGKLNVNDVNNLTFDLKFNECEEYLMGSITSPSKSYTISGLSDKYDPFLSAKRQLEELCSPTQISAPRISSTAPSTKPKLISSISTTSPSNPSSVRSNFRRTCSLRAPRKTPPTRPLFIPPTLHRPTIQRGISDEGPISHNFLKPEEYDEMPVKSVCVNDFAATHSPKVIKRDPNTNLTRRNLRLNLNKTNDKSNPLSKTDSLAIFLKYESEAKKIESPVDFTEKDLKDKSNTLSKQTSLKVVSNSTDQSSGGDKENVPTLKDSLANILENKSCFDYSKSRDSSSHKISNKMYPIKLEPLPKMPSLLSCNSSVPPANVNLSSILDSKDNDFIDPKLINICDNLPMNITKLSDSDLTSSSTDSASTTKFLAESQQQQQHQQQSHRQAQYQQSNPNRNSTERKNLLKRQMRFGKNQFLYDMSPESDPYSEECDKTISLIESSNKMFDSPANEPSFDDFDFEEFLSSFENDEEQFPIFKDCKEFLMNRTFNKRINNYSECSNRSPSHPNSDFENDRNKSEIFISIETSQNGSTPSPTNPSTHGELEDVDGNDNKIENFNTIETLVHDEKHDMFNDFTDVNRNNARNIMKQFEQDFGTNEQNIGQMTGSGTTTYPVDSDDISSVECFPLRRSTKSKQSADSAYGSLSRHSPTEQRSARRNLSRSRQHSAASIPEQQSLLLKYHPVSDSKPRNRDASISSSGSETSLPPIQAQKAKEQQQKKELKMFKYCHECGSEFPITHAKFCMECGVRRIVLE